MKLKQFLLSLLVLLIPLSAKSYDACINSIYYNFSGTNATVTYATTSYNSYSGDISIPASVTYSGTNYNVTEIGYRAFYNCRNLTSITIPSSVKTINHYAFYNCSSLSSANIANGVTTIGDAAFARSGITSLSIPKSVTGIYSSAFNYCSNLASITVASNNSYYDSRNSCNAIIMKSTNYLILGCKNTVIPNSVTRIENGAFYGCNSLSYIAIPNSVSEIGQRAFQDCSSLTSITIPSSITNIDSYAFKGCNRLNKVIVSDLTAWCNIIFSNHESNPLYYAKHIYSDANNEIRNITIPSNVTKINSYAFYNCQGLESVTIPSTSTLASISNYAFYDCTGLTKVIVPNISKWCIINFSDYSSNPLYYAKHIYSDANNEIINISIPSSVTSIGSCSFIGCIGITSITIPSSIISIGNAAFENCSGLTKVIVPNLSKWYSINFSNWSSNPLYYAKHIYSDTNTEITNLTIPYNISTIGAYSFIGCSGIKNITIPYNVKTIDFAAFEGCNSLSSVTIPNGVTTIGIRAFSGCTGLTSVSIPQSVTTIGSNAFCNCNNLTLVKVYIESPISITNTTFSNSANATLCVLRGCKDAYEAAAYWNDFYEIVEVIDFEDTKVKSKCVANWDTNGDGELSEAEAAAVSNLGEVFRYSDITSFNELQYFTGLTSIGAYAFQFCNNLSSIIIPEGVISIGNYAFANNPISDVQIPASVQSIGENAFGGSWDDCPDNDESYCWVYYPNTYTVSEDNQYYSSHRGILYNKDKTRLIDCPVGYCQDIYFPSTLKEILSNAFSGNGYLDGRNLYIYDLTKFCQINIIGTPYLGGSVFSKINKVYIYTTHYWSDGDSFQQYDEHTTSLNIPNDVKTIGKGTFFGWKKLTNVTFPATGVEEIGDYAFACTKINNVTLPATVQTIGQNAFYQEWDEYVYDEDGDWCSTNTWTMAMDSLTIPQSVQSIGSNAFNLTNGARVTSKSNTPNNIASNAFKNASNCTLAVRHGLQNTYSQKTGWNAFGTIEEDEDIIPYIDGEVFTATTPDGLEMTFKVLSASEKTVQVGDGTNAAIDQSYEGDVIIPTQINGLTIKKIGNGAFEECKHLYFVDIPENVILGDGAFERANLKKIIVKTAISDATFWCANIGELIIDSSVSYGGYQAFFQNKIDRLVIKPSETALTYSNGRNSYPMFEDCNIGTAIIERNMYSAYYGSGTKNPFMYSTIDSLYVRRDFSCESSSNIANNIGDIFFEGLTNIDSYGYRNKTSISRIHFSEGLSSISSNAFTSSFENSIILPSSLTSIGDNAISISSAPSVTSLATTPPSITETSFGSNTTYNIPLYVPQGCREQYASATGWNKFTNIIELGDYGNIISFADSEAKKMCIRYYDVDGDDEISEGEALLLTFIKGFGSSSITSFNELGSYFTNLTSIGSSAFYGCSGLTSITLPENLTSIGDYAFSYCTSLTSITLPNSVTSIESSAFAGCSGLTSITIPNSVTNIGFSAFNNCSNLTSVVSEIEDPFTFGNNAFRYISNYCVLTVPSGTRDAYIAAGWTEEVFKVGCSKSSFCARPFFMLF